ncbi:MAG: transglutaminase-like domain-containing protein [Nanoarchaeota archaeon]
MHKKDIDDKFEKEKIHEEIRQEAMRDQEPELKFEPIVPPILKYIVAIFLVLAMALMVVPYYGWPSDAEPSQVPTREELITNDMPDIIRPEGSDLRLYMDSTSPEIKQTALRIATASCDGETICQSKAIYYFVQDNFDYVGEIDSYVQTPLETLYAGGGDCKDLSVLLASMQRAIGVPVRFVKVPGHVYVDVYIEDAPSRYRTNDGWISLESTCGTCDFGELPSEYDKDAISIKNI